MLAKPYPLSGLLGMDWHGCEKKGFLSPDAQQPNKLSMVLISCFLCFVSNLMAAPGPSTDQSITQVFETTFPLIELSEDPLSIIMSHLGPADLRSLARVNKYFHQAAEPERNKRYSLEIIDDTVIISKHSAKGPPQMLVQFPLSHLSDGKHDTPQGDNLKLLAKLIEQSPQSLVISEVKILQTFNYPPNLKKALETIETELFPVLKKKFSAIEIDSQIHLIDDKTDSDYLSQGKYIQEAVRFFLRKPRDTKLVLASFPQDVINRYSDRAAKAGIESRAILTSENSPSLDLGFLREIYQLSAEDLATKLKEDPGAQDRLRRNLGVGFSEVLWRNSHRSIVKPAAPAESALNLAHVPDGHLEGQDVQSRGDVQKLMLLLNYEPSGFLKHATLLKAIEDGNEELVELLLRAGAPLEFDKFFDAYSHSSALSLAVFQKDLPMVKLLLAFGASIDRVPDLVKFVAPPIIQAVKKPDAAADEAKRNLILIELLKAGDLDFQKKFRFNGLKTLAEIAVYVGNQGALQIIQNAWQVQQAAHVGQSFPICRPESSLHVTPFSKIFDMLRMGAQPAF
jgi:hypothetical protein